VIPLTGLVCEMERLIIPEFKRFKLDEVEFLVTSINGGFYKNTSLSIMAIHNAFTQMGTLYRIRRMKGIGEMDKKHLVQTCLDPKTRSCTYIKGIGDIGHIRELMGDKSDARKVLVMNKVE
jgi:DNA gyrase/topoisomerase IV subunit B